LEAIDRSEHADVDDSELPARADRVIIAGSRRGDDRGRRSQPCVDVGDRVRRAAARIDAVHELCRIGEVNRIVAEAQASLVPHDLVGDEAQRFHARHPPEADLRPFSFSVDDAEQSLRAVEQRDRRLIVVDHVEPDIGRCAEMFEVADAPAHDHRQQA
jgi:hypothetical protein